MVHIIHGAYTTVPFFVFWKLFFSTRLLITFLFIIKLSRIVVELWTWRSEWLSPEPYSERSQAFNPLVPDAPFLLTLETSEKPYGFLMFAGGGVEKGCIGNEWVKMELSVIFFFHKKFHLS